MRRHGAAAEASLPGSAAHDPALAALGCGVSTACLVCGIAAAVAALLTAFGVIGVRARGDLAEAGSLDAVTSGRAAGGPRHGRRSPRGVAGSSWARPHPCAHPWCVNSAA
ncbi:hypothetical protein [Streptomyces albogriseolus]|uniref:hypothetical protein n=1 Tax=Streptomyces albogriseolus TaxID=1887 RepID=UPI0033BE939D